MPLSFQLDFLFVNSRLSVRANSLSLIYEIFSPSDCKDMEIRKLDFVTKARLLFTSWANVIICKVNICCCC